MRIVAALVARERGITWCEDDGRGALDGRVVAGTADGGPMRRGRLHASPGDAHQEGEPLERARRGPEILEPQGAADGPEPARAIDGRDAEVPSIARGRRCRSR